MIDQVQIPEEISTRNYVQMYVGQSPIIAVGKTPIQKHSDIINETLDGLVLPHGFIHGKIPEIARTDYVVVSMGNCHLENKVWTFNESIWRVGREDPRIDGHFAQFKKLVPGLEIRVKTRHGNIINI